MKTLFHLMAGQGKAITEVRKEYATKGACITAYRAHAIVLFRAIKEAWAFGSNPSETNTKALAEKLSKKKQPNVGQSVGRHKSITLKN